MAVTSTQIQVEIETLTDSVLSAYSVIKTNQDKPELAKGTAPYVRQEILFSSGGQFELGNTATKRKTGVVMFYIFVRANTGAGARNTLLDIVVNSFGSTRTGRATCGKAVITQGASQLWEITAVEVPFHYHDL